MAITNLIPVFDRVSRPNLKLITSNISAERLKPKKFLIIITIVFMICFLLQSFVSLWVTTDAFVLQDLKHQRNLVQDQRDAILIQVNEKSAPSALAEAAKKIGMKPVDTISYINVVDNGQ